MNKTGLYVDSKNNRVFWGGEQVRIGKVAFRFLELLYIWRGRTVRPDDIMDYVYADYHKDEPFYGLTMATFAFNLRALMPGLPLRGFAFLGGGGYRLD